MWVEGRSVAAGDADQVFANYQVVSPLYFATMGIPLLRGRMFTDERPAGRRSPSRLSASGRRDGFGGMAIRSGSASVPPSARPDPGVSTDAEVVYEIVGRGRGRALQRVRGRAPGFDLYASVEQTFSGDAFFVVRTAGDAAALAQSVGPAVREVDPNQSIFDLRALADRLADATWQSRLSATVLTGLAVPRPPAYGGRDLRTARLRDGASRAGTRRPRGAWRRRRGHPQARPRPGTPSRGGRPRRGACRRDGERTVDAGAAVRRLRPGSDGPRGRAAPACDGGGARVCHPGPPCGGGRSRGDVASSSERDIPDLYGGSPC